jgi:hypothetical protein
VPLKLPELGKKKLVSEKIDKLTNSIENAITGDVLQTEFHRIRKADLRQINPKDWEFDWHEEFAIDGNEVYKLTTKGNIDVIQGLISLRVEPDHVFVSLVESAKFNKRKSKMYLGVLGNLFAFACKGSFDDGLGGFVAFIAKTNLVEHFKEEIGAIQIGRQRMVIENLLAARLIEQYFKS